MFGSYIRESVLFVRIEEWTDYTTGNINGDWRPPSNVVVVMMFKILNTQSVNVLWPMRPFREEIVSQAKAGCEGLNAKVICESLYLS